MKEEERVKFITRIAKELGIKYPLANLPKEIVIKFNTNKGWRVELDEKKKTYWLDNSASLPPTPRGLE